MNARLDANHRMTLMEREHVQPVTLLGMDNTTTHDVMTKQIMPKRSKEIDMRFYWLRDRNNQKNHLCWKPGSKNLADYHTKYHPPAHYRRERSIYLASNAFTLQK